MAAPGEIRRTELIDDAGLGTAVTRDLLGHARVHLRLDENRVDLAGTGALDHRRNVARRRLLARKRLDNRHLV